MQSKSLWEASKQRPTSASRPWSDFVPPIGLAALVFGMSVKPSAVNSITAEISEYLRLIFISLSFVSLLYIFVKYKIINYLYLSIFSFIIIFLYIHLIGYNNLFIIENNNNIYASFLITLALIVFIGTSLKIEYQKEFSIILVFMAIAWSVFMYYVDAINLSVPLKFNFEIYSKEGYLFDYTQGTTFFYGLSSICCASLLRESLGRRISVLYLFILVVLSSLSLAGGSRGEIIFSLFIIFIILKPSGVFYTLLSIIFALVSLFYIISFIINVNTDIVIVSRFYELIIGGNLGLRDVLFSQSIDLIKNQLNCMLIGCGALYFQFYYNHPYELYPHNLLIEYAISAGLIITLLISFLSLYGTLNIKNKNSVFYICIYCIFISMKSGDIYNAWIANAFLFYTAAYGSFLIYNRGRGEVRL